VHTIVFFNGHGGLSIAVHLTGRSPNAPRPPFPYIINFQVKAAEGHGLPVMVEIALNSLPEIAIETPTNRIFQCY
jgi:hypothetical protein